MLKSVTIRSTLAAVACLISLSAYAIADDVPKQLNVAAGKLVTALESLSKQAAVELVYQPEQLKSFRTSGVKGTYTPDAAVRILLKGTPLDLHTDPSGAMVISPSTPTGVPAETGAKASTFSEKGEGKRSFWDRFRLAQADQGASSSTSSVGTSAASKSSSGENDLDSERNKDKYAKLEEVVVTAQKRTENLQEVPVSVQVISGDYLTQQNQNSLYDLSRTVPDLHILNVGKGNLLSLRGVGAEQADNPGFEQAVTLFADDIYRGRSRMSNSTFLDLDRIEILKGPQSTFFGNNAIAGALNIISKKPGDTFEGYIRALGGMFEEYALEGAAGGPVSDTLRARLAVSANGNERGWLTDLTSGDHVPRIHNLAGRLTFVYQPMEALDATLKLEGSHHKTLGTALDEPQQWSVCPHPPFPTSFAAGFVQCDTAMGLGVPFGLGTNNVKLLPGEQNQLTNAEGVLTVNYRQWNHTFTSVTGYSYFDFFSDLNPGYAPAPAVITAEWREHFHQFSQEFRLTSPTGQPIEYLAGAYFQTDRFLYDQVDVEPYLNSFFQSIYQVPPQSPYLPFAYRQGIVQPEDIYSVFGSLTWNATDRLKLSAGLRGSKVDKDHNAHALYGTSTQLYGGFIENPQSLQQLVASAFGIALGTSPDVSKSDRALMPSARIQYQFNPEVMGYLRYDRGFLAGGFNGADTFDFGHITQFGPEHVNAYEVGVKSKWLNDTVLLNLDVFRADYTDLQVSTNKLSCLAGTCIYISDLANAAKSRSQGVELEGQWVPVRDLRLGANVTYLDAYFVSYPNANPGALQSYCGGLSAGAFQGTPQCVASFAYPVPQIADNSGQPTGYAPKWSGSLTAAYAMTLAGDFKFTSELDPYFTSSYQKDRYGIIPAQGNYVRLDARLAFGPANDRWSLDLIGKNLTNRTILIGDDVYTFTKERPRSVALQFRYRF